MKRKGYALAAIGLVSGILVGIAILGIKAYAGSALVDLLEEEVQKSCNCVFLVDDIDVSLTTLKARAKNARIEEDGKVRLRFREIDAHFSLRRFKENQISLTHLILKDGFSNGVTEDTATFKFIDSLAAPIPPERDYPGRWRIRLERLTMVNSSFWEEGEDTRLMGEDVGLDMERNAEDDFVLKPLIEKLKLGLKDDRKISTVLTLGRVTSEIVLTDDLAEFHPIKISLGEAFAAGDVIADLNQGNLLSGELSFSADAPFVKVDSFLETDLAGKAQSSGSLGNPSLKGSFRQNKNSLTKLVLGSYSTLPLEQVSGKFEYDFAKGDHNLTVTNLKGLGSAGSVSSSTPLTIRDGKLDGGLEIEIIDTQIGEISLRDSKITLQIDQSLSEPRVRASGLIGAAQYGSFAIENIAGSIDFVNDVLTFNTARKSSELGELTTSGSINFPAEGDPIIQSLKAGFDNFAVVLPENEEDPDNLVSEVRVTGSVDLEGPLNFDKLKGAGSLVVSSRHFEGESALQGGVDIQNGYITAKLFNSSKSIDFQYRGDLRARDKSLLELTLDGFKPQEYDPRLECAELSLAGQYEFWSKEPKEGEGTLQLNKVKLGCAPYTLESTEKQVFPIYRGNIRVSDLSFTGPETDVVLSGSVSLKREIDLNARGRMFLEPLLTFIPTLDDLNGIAELDANLSGNVAAPILKGRVKLKDADLSMEAAGVSATAIAGELSLVEGKLEVVNLSGKLNSGVVQLDGTIDPLDLAASNLKIHVDSIVVNPTPESSITVSSELELSQSELTDKLQLVGQIMLEGGEIQKTFDVRTVVNAITSYVFQTDKAKLYLSNWPDILMDIEVTGSGNLFILSNLLEAELDAQLHISGNLNTPFLTGDIKTLSGWFGYKDRRFDITSALTRLLPEEELPQLDLIGETSVVTRTGEVVYVIMEAHGPLTNPKISLTSDSSLSDQELITLITSGIRTEDRATFDRLSEQEADDSGVRGFLRALAKLDSLSLEPGTNLRSGLIEPKLVARKNIRDDLAIIGESFFGSSVGGSKLKLLYQLMDDVDLSGIIDTESTQDKTALGADLEYTILSKQKEFLRIQVEGNHSFSDQKLLRSIRLTSASRLLPDEDQRIVKTITDFYVKEGFFDATAQTTCHDLEVYCRDLSINISEGPRHTISQIKVENELPTEQLDLRPFYELQEGTVATESTRSRYHKTILSKLRSEGYIGARVSTEYLTDEALGASVLKIEIAAGQPVSFTFIGNTAFSAEDFLKTINLFERKQPFGNNTIRILVENIERQYREAGYLFASINYSKAESSSADRINYIININEEQKVTVRNVLFDGNNAISDLELERLVQESYPDEYTTVFEPTFAISEELDYNLLLLQNIYREYGFPDVKITFKIKPASDVDKVDLRYKIEEGQQTLAATLGVEGWPAGVKLPDQPGSPYSIPRANRFINRLLSTLKKDGFYQPSISSSLTEDQKRLVLEVEPGPQAVISAVQIDGNVAISKEVIQSHLAFAAGSSWNYAKIARSRRELLRLGLFSRVSITPQDKAVDSVEEIVVVRVVERALRALRVGGGVNSEFGIHLFTEATDKQFFGDGRSLILRLDSYYDPRINDISHGVANLRFLNPAIFGSDFRLTNDFRFQKLELSTFEFDLNRIQFDTTLSRDFSSRFSGAFSHSILQEDLDNVSTDAILGPNDSGTVELSFITGALTYDRRDNPISPSSGFRTNFETRYAAPSFGSDAHYVSVGGRFSFLLPIGDSPLSFANNTRAASAWTLGSTGEVPITQRYYLGGRNSVRGFRENSLGPQGSAGSVLGGDLLLANNFELRYRLADSLTALTFLDTGSVFLKDRDVSLGDLRYSTGVGLRYNSPIGPIGFDIATPIEEESGEPSVRFHFSIGSSF